MSSPQLFDGLTLLTPLAGVVVPTGTPFLSDVARRPHWAKWGSLWINTADEVAVASLVPELHQYPQGDRAGSIAPLTWWTLAAITTETDSYDALGVLSTESWTAQGWRSQTVIAPPPVFRLQLTCSGAGASFLVRAAMDWFGSG